MPSPLLAAHDPWWIGAGLAAAATAVVGTGWWRGRSARELADPRADPGASRVTAAVREALERALLLETATDRVTAAIEACVIGGRPWRAGLRRVAADLEALPATEESAAVRALWWGLLGEIGRAAEQLAAVPADRWQGCWARHLVYAAARDHDRAESALVAALHLAPDHGRPTVRAALEDLRRRRPRRRSEAERLFDG